MPRRKIVIASMMHETNTFSPIPTALPSFRPLSGEAAIAEFEHTNTQLGGFLDVAQRMGAEIVVPLAANAHPSGYVERRAYEDMCAALVGGIRGGCDAAFLALHGAMVAEHVDDGEGELLRRTRAVAPRLPIAVGLDFHTQLTPAMVENATVITGYRTYPHIDMADTAQRAASTLLRTLDGAVKPVMVWGIRPMLTSTLEHTPSRQPMKDVMDMAIDAEARGVVLNASVLGGFPQSDIPHLSCSAIVVCDGATDRGQALLDRMLDLAGERRADFLYEGAPPAVTAKVARITDGEFVVTGPMATGTRVRMGRTAVLDTGAMQIVVSERRAEPFDLGVFTHAGIDPRRKRYVLIKSRQHFRAGFEPIARHIVLCDGDGVTSSDLALFDYRKRRRPLYPFEPSIELDGEPVLGS